MFWPRAVCSSGHPGPQFQPAASDSFVEMGFKSHAFEVWRENKEMNAPTDRTKWFMTPQTINAYLLRAISMST